MVKENPLKRFFRWRWAPFVGLVAAALLCVGALSLLVPSDFLDSGVRPRKVANVPNPAQVQSVARKADDDLDAPGQRPPSALRGGESSGKTAQTQHERGFTPPSYLRPDLKPEVQESIRRGMEVAKAYEDGVPDEYIEDMYYRRHKRTLPIDRESGSK